MKFKLKIVILLVLHYVGLTQHIHKELPDSAYFDFLRLKTELLPILHINAEDVQEYLHDKEGFFASFLIQNAHLGKQQKFDLIKKELIASYPDYVTHKKTYIPQPAPTVVNGPCTNIDFENGTTSGWQGTTGIACNRDQPCNQVPGFSATRHVITSAGTTDPYIPTLSTVYPGGGGSSIRIEDYASGSDLGLRNGNATTLSQTFMVTPDNNLFTYHYAAVVEDPDDHDDAERPYFKVRMYDESGAEIACASYTVIAKPPLRNFTRRQVRSPYRNGNNAIMDLYYRDWATVSIPLIDFVGQNITVRFTASDCTPRGHLAYAYVDAECAAIDPPQDTTICGSTPKALKAPDGFDTYAWTGPGIIGSRTTQAIMVNRAGVYEVTLTPFSDDPCPIKMQYTVVQICPVDPIKDTLCETIKGSKATRGVDLTQYNTRVIGTRTGINVQAWYQGAVSTSNRLSPATHVTVADGVTYYAVTSLPDTVPLTFLILSKPNITFPDVPPVCEGTPSFRINGVLPVGGVFSGPHTTAAGVFTPTLAGVYNIQYKYTNAAGCTDSTSKEIRVLKPAIVNAASVSPLCATSTSVSLSGTSVNTTSVIWSGGGGTFQNANTLHPTYIPTEAERKGGAPIVLTLRGIANAPCPLVSDTVHIRFVPAPTLEIQDVPAICTSFDSIVLRATSSDTKGVLWAGGKGTFSDAGALSTSYFPSASEKRDANPVVLKLNAYASAPCTSINDTITLHFIRQPSIDLIKLDPLCNNIDSIRLVAQGQHTQHLKWSSEGRLLAETRDLSIVYYPTTTEKNAGKSLIYVTAVGQTPCVPSNDSIEIEFIKMPTINATDLGKFCNTVQTVALQGTSQNTSAVQWSGGTGSLQSKDSLVASYVPSAIERVNLQPVVFTFTGFGLTPCPSVIDTISMSMVPKPTVDLMPVADICATTDSFKIGLRTTDVQSMLWHTPGGVIKNVSINEVVYYLTSAEKQDSLLLLRLEVTGASSCPSDSDSVSVRLAQPATVIASQPLPICQSSDSLALSAISTHATSVSWGGGSGGSFTSSTSESSGYHLSAGEQLKDSLIFYVEAMSKTPCAAAKDTVVVKLVPMPQVDALEVPDLCETVDSVQLKASGDFLSDLDWSGVGTFHNKTKSSSTYLPSAVEKASGLGLVKIYGKGLAPCADVEDSVKLRFVASPTVDITPITPFCGDKEEVMLHGTSNNTVKVLWTGGEGRWTSSNSIQATYHPSAKERQGSRVRFALTGFAHAPCVNVTDTVEGLIYPLPPTSNTQVTFCNDDEGNAKLDAGLGMHYLWLNRGDTTRYINVQEPNTYEVDVRNAFGCSVRRNITAIVECPPKLFISNAFSPNNDGVNDLYTVYGVHIGKFHMLIFNRWGEIIFESNHMKDVWDGNYRNEPMPIGVYEWLITYEGDSEKYKGPYKMKGSVTVVR